MNLKKDRMRKERNNFRKTWLMNEIDLFATKFKFSFGSMNLNYFEQVNLNSFRKGFWGFGVNSWNHVIV